MSTSPGVLGVLQVVEACQLAHHPVAAGGREEALGQVLGAVAQDLSLWDAACEWSVGGWLVVWLVGWLGGLAGWLCYSIAWYLEGLVAWLLPCYVACSLG